MQQYALWFVNQSGYSGKVCVYQDKKNVTSNQNFDVLAWQLMGANKSVMVRFIWAIDYDFAWFEYAPNAPNAPNAPIRSQQIESADLSTTNSIVLSHNSYGFNFQQPQSSPSSGTLYITQDQNIPSVNSAYVGIGMHKAGTFAHRASPRTKLSFKPSPSSALKYWISFGQYPYEVNDVISVGDMNPTGEILFPFKVYTMTATLSASHTWNIKPGEPVVTNALSEIIAYEAGKGIISGKT